MSSDPREFFSRHHHAYLTSDRHARGADLDMLIERLHPSPGQRAVDVATGTGHTAIKLAALGLAVEALDITPEMLEEGKRLARDRGVTIDWTVAAAEALPEEDQTVDIVTCRRAAHHFRDVAGFLREALRILRPGGRLGVSDMTAPEDALTWLNQLEQLRDPSHNAALSPSMWEAQVGEAGFVDIKVELSQEPMSWQAWLTPVTPESTGGKKAMARCASPDAPASIIQGAQFIKHRLILVASKG